MPIYTIRIDYTTEESLGASRAFRNFGINWEDLNKAKLALKYIREHYQAHLEKTEESMVKDKPWYYDPQVVDSTFPNRPFWKEGLAVESDNVTMWVLPSFWTGSFSALYGAEIVLVDDPDLKFTC